MNLKRTAIDVAAVVAANVIFDKFIARVEGQEGGFITVSPGLGVDDAVRAAVIVIVLGLAHKFGG